MEPWENHNPRSSVCDLVFAVLLLKSKQSRLCCSRMEGSYWISFSGIYLQDVSL